LTAAGADKVGALTTKPAINPRDADGLLMMNPIAVGYPAVVGQRDTIGV